MAKTKLIQRSEPRPTYTAIDELFASATEPLPTALRQHQLTRMFTGLQALERGEQPTKDDWRVCSDAVNLMETMIDMEIVADPDGLLMDAITGLALAGKRNLAGGAIRLDGPGIQSVRALLADYATLIEQLPARTMIKVHRATEKRLREILSGRKRPHDVEVIDL